MSVKLTNIRELGRFKNVEAGKEYNLKKGTNKQRGVDVIFYLYRGKRQVISDRDFHSIYGKVVNEVSVSFYCQRDIEGESKCTSQCDQCYGYYKPLNQINSHMFKPSKKHLEIFKVILRKGSYKPTYSDQEPATKTLIKNGIVEWREDFRGVELTKFGKEFVSKINLEG